MQKNFFRLAALLLLLIGTLIFTCNIKLAESNPSIWIVDDDGPADFSSIQEAVNAASAGDTVFVRNGTYFEHVIVNKTLSVIGECKESTIIDGSGSGIGVSIVSDNTTVSGFEVRQVEYNIAILNCREVKIYNNILKAGKYKILLENIDNCSIANNFIEGGWRGITLVNCSNIKIFNNEIVRCNAYTLPIGPFFGVFLNNATMNLIENNRIFECDIGIGFTNSSYNIMQHNVISGVWPTGYPAYDAEIGIELAANSSGNVIRENEISNMTQTAAVFRDSNNTILYHNNFVNNTVQVELDNAIGNMWDNGYPSGGNYWSDYTGFDEYNGPGQNETGSDGIGDAPYMIDLTNQDRYPFMNPLTPWSDWMHYHNYTEIVNTLLYLKNKYPETADVFSIGKSWQNKDIYCIRLTNESFNRPKPKVFFVGYHHARELISAELPLYFIVKAITEFGTSTILTHMLNYSEIFVVPALNVDGFDAVKLNHWQRKNAYPSDEDADGLFDEDPPDDEDGDGYVEYLFSSISFIRWEGLDDDGDGSYNEDWVGGVDLNRNYGYQWNASCQSGSPYTWAEDYRGPAPFSEPETQAIRDLALAHNFKYAVSFHSGTELILYPWGYVNQPTPHDTLFREIAKNLSMLTGAAYQRSARLYTVSGCWDDWMYANRSTFAFTCEIYVNDSAWQYEPGPQPNTWWGKGILQAFNPDPDAIETVVQRWFPVFTHITNRAITEAYDIATTNITTFKTVVGEGYSMRLNITILNKGEFTETFNVTSYANASLIQTKEVTLTAKSSTTLTFTWNTSNFAKGDFLISASAEPIYGENRTVDNYLTDGYVKVTIPGDIKCDSNVNFLDAILLGVSFNSQLNDPNWNSNVDLNDDNYVDYEDALVMRTYFGQIDP